MKIFNRDLSKNVEIYFLLLLIIISIYITLHMMNWITIDDAYITYRYAKNIATGKGLVYNQGEHILSTTTPLYAIILAGCYFINHDLRLDSIIIGVLCLMLSMFVIYAIFSKEKVGLAFMLASALILSNIYFYYTVGMETLFYLLLILLTIYFYIDRNYIYSALFLGLAVITRIDALMLLPCLVLDYIYINRNDVIGAIKSRNTLNFLVTFIFILLPWLLFSLVYFGSPLPLTLKSKIVHFESGIWISSTQNMVNILLAQYPIFILFFIIGMFFIIIKYKKFLPIATFFVIYCIGYMNLPNYPWYLVPALALFFMISSIGIYAAIEFVYNICVGHLWLEKNLITMVLAIVIIYLFITSIYPHISSSLSFVNSHLTISDQFENRLSFYKYIGEKISANTPENSSVGAAEIGIIGWFSNRYMIDYCGLLQPAIIDHFRNDSIYDFYSPDYIVYSPIFDTIIPTYPLIGYEIQDKYNVSGEQWYLLKKINFSGKNIDHLFFYFNKSLNDGVYRETMFTYLNLSGDARFALSENWPGSGETQLYFTGVSLQNNTTLRFGIGLQSSTLISGIGEGMKYKIYIKDDTNSTLIFDEYLYTGSDTTTWSDYSMNLSSWSGRNVTFILVTSPSNGSAAYAKAYWSDPVLIHS